MTDNALREQFRDAMDRAIVAAYHSGFYSGLEAAKRIASGHAPKTLAEFPEYQPPEGDAHHGDAR